MLTVVDQSRAPNDQSRVQHARDPATPSSVDYSNRYNQRSAEKLQLQAVVTITEITVSPINKLPLLPKLSPFVEQVFGGENIMWGGGGFKDRGGEVSVNENTATTTPSKDSAENV